MWSAIRSLYAASAKSTGTGPANTAKEMAIHAEAVCNTNCRTQHQRTQVTACSIAVSATIKTYSYQALQIAATGQPFAYATVFAGPLFPATSMSGIEISKSGITSMLQLLAEYNTELQNGTFQCTWSWIRLQLPLPVLSVRQTIAVAVRGTAECASIPKSTTSQQHAYHNWLTAD